LGTIHLQYTIRLKLAAAMCSHPDSTVYA